MILRILSNTTKHIKRSGWIGWASISVMALAFLVCSIFGMLAYISNLYIKFIEQRSNIIVFFSIGMDPAIISELQAKWELEPMIKDISFTSEEEAYNDYADYAQIVLPETYAVLKNQDEKKLNSSLDIQLMSLDSFEEVQEIVQLDINAKLDELRIIDTTEAPITESTTETGEVTTDETSGSATGEEAVEEGIIYKYQTSADKAPIVLVTDSESIEGQREVFFWLRVAGIAVISMLLLVVFFFTFMTVEFRLYNQMEEIGVMQLVGGSLFFIRSPYILEGGYYGLMGSLISTSILGTIYVIVFQLNRNSELAKFLYENFGKLPWPELTYIHLAGIIGLLALVGFLMGAISSYLSIRRYIR